MTYSITHLYLHPVLAYNHQLGIYLIYMKGGVWPHTIDPTGILAFYISLLIISIPTLFYLSDQKVWEALVKKKTYPGLQFQQPSIDIFLSG